MSRKEPRVLSLLSASTEIVSRLGCAHMLVGRSHGCDDPPAVTSLPVATAPRVDPNAPSLELDQAVRAQAAAGGPIYNIHDAFVREAAPDVIITQEQCRICAVTPEDVATACAALPKVNLVTIKPTTLDDVLSDVQTIANALGVPERGARLVSYMRARLAALSTIVKPIASEQPTVAHLEWIAPMMGSGYWIAECAEAAGCKLVHGTRGGHSMTLPSVSMLANADVLLIAPCGFSIERTHAELKELSLCTSAEWLALPAVKAGRVAVADGNLYFNRSSCAGLVDGAEIMAEIAHEAHGLCGLFGQHGKSWVRLSELDAFCARKGAAPANKEVVLAADAVEEPPKKFVKTTHIKADGAPRTPVEHVHAQIDAMRADDFELAFALNSEANQARLGDAAKFAMVVGGSAVFRVLKSSQTACDVTQGGTEKEIRVKAQPKGGDAVRFAFDLCCDAAGRWATDGVRIEC